MLQIDGDSVLLDGLHGKELLRMGRTRLGSDDLNLVLGVNLLGNLLQRSLFLGLLNFASVLISIV